MLVSDFSSGIKTNFVWHGDFRKNLEIAQTNQTLFFLLIFENKINQLIGFSVSMF